MGVVLFWVIVVSLFKFGYKVVLVFGDGGFM